MPTQVSTARGCLAAEAAAALDEAVAVARRRCHAQTTSLHVVYALLHSATAAGGAGDSSAPSSILRDALSRARSSAYSSRLQFKALELCFGVALDRLPSSSGQRHVAEGGRDEPPVSNSLMAAIKRSQANQRRNPETFHLYQQQQSAAAAAGAASTFSGVKVEIQQLVLAILDDPVVSRVFGDAGFRSTDIKYAILRPSLPILRFPPSARCPPLFLCNFSSGDGFEAPVTTGRPVFPFAPDGGVENCRRIGEILSQKGRGRNPMLVGVCAGEAARDFARTIEQQNWAVLPLDLRGMELVGIERVATIDTRMEELGKKGETPGLLVNIGNLKEMVEGNAEGDDRDRSLVSELTRLLEVHQGRLWLMGWSATYETYMKFLSRHPLLDKDWNLQLLPITSIRSGVDGSARPPRLMDSFVPFGRFFPTALESNNLVSCVYPSASLSKDGNNKCEEEISIVCKGNLPFWLRKADTDSLTDGFDAAKGKDDNAFLHAKTLELQRMWNENYQKTKTDIPGFPGALDQSYYSEMNGACSKSSENPDETQKHKEFAISSPVSIGSEKIAIASHNIPFPLVIEPRNGDLSSKLHVSFSKSGQLQSEGFQSQQADDHTSPSSITSVATDLVLGILPESSVCKEQNPASRLQRRTLEEPSCCLPLIDAVKVSASNFPVVSFPGCQDSIGTSICQVNPTHLFSLASSSCASAHGKASSTTCQKIDLSNHKSFCTSLIDKVGWQKEAAIAISQAIFHCRSGKRCRGPSQRGDIWLNFHGPDKSGKKRVAVALAELICGSKSSFVCIDLSCQDGVCRPNTICAQQEITKNEVHFRGKLCSDLIAAELNKKQSCVLYLENVDKADFLVQSSLSRAIQTGRFRDSHGRESSINNAIFILVSGAAQGQTSLEGKDCNSFCEETVLAAQCWQMKILAEPCGETNRSNLKANRVSFAPIQKPRDFQVYLGSVSPSKRKRDVLDNSKSHHETLMSAERTHTTTNAFLDLNLPVQEVKDDDSSSNEERTKSENIETWLKEISDLVDQTVDFMPFNFDALANRILRDISNIFCSAFGLDCRLEIDQKVMEELLAAAWSLEDRIALDDWFEQVLGRSFIEMRSKNNLSSHYILRLVACEDTIAEEHPPGLLLPSRIIIN